MTDKEFIDTELEFKSALTEYYNNCMSFGVDFRDRVLDCVHDELVSNDLEGICFDL